MHSMAEQRRFFGSALPLNRKEARKQEEAENSQSATACGEVLGSRVSQADALVPMTGVSESVTRLIGCPEEYVLWEATFEPEVEPKQKTPEERLQELIDSYAHEFEGRFVEEQDVPTHRFKESHRHREGKKKARSRTEDWRMRMAKKAREGVDYKSLAANDR